jgi:hypothetical protein
MNHLARHIEGCSLNPLEFVLGDDGKPIAFDTPDMARDFYLASGGTQEDLDESCVMITDADGVIL